MSNPAGYSFVIQLLVLGLLSVIASPLGWGAVCSLSLGGIVSTIPNIYFTYYAFRFRFNGPNPVSAETVVQSLRRAEWGKFLFVAVGFALTFKWVSPLDEALLFLGFFCMVVLQWFLAIQISNKWANLNNQAYKDKIPIN